MTDHGPCTRWAVSGARRCKTHGGTSPQALAQAAQRVAADQLGALLGEPEVLEPTHAILRQVYAAAGQVTYITGILAAGQVVPQGRVKPRPLTAPESLLLHRSLAEAQDRLVRFSKTAIDAGLAERTVRMAEATTAAIVAVVAGILDAPEMNLTGPQKLRGRELAHRLLMDHSTLMLVEQRTA